VSIAVNEVLKWTHFPRYDTEATQSTVWMAHDWEALQTCARGDVWVFRHINSLLAKLRKDLFPPCVTRCKARCIFGCFLFQFIPHNETARRRRQYHVAYRNMNILLLRAVYAAGEGLPD
jgi:hypothetical protein